MGRGLVSLPSSSGFADDEVDGGVVEDALWHMAEIPVGDASCEGVERPMRIRQANSFAFGQEHIRSKFWHAVHLGFFSSHFLRRRRQHRHPVLQRDRRGLSSMYL